MKTNYQISVASLSPTIALHAIEKMCLRKGYSVYDDVGINGLRIYTGCARIDVSRDERTFKLNSRSYIPLPWFLFPGASLLAGLAVPVPAPFSHMAGIAFMLLAFKLLRTKSREQGAAQARKFHDDLHEALQAEAVFAQKLA
jgi:hypothetical protein